MVVDRDDRVIVAVVEIARRRWLVVDRCAVINAIEVLGLCRIPHPSVMRQRRIGAERTGNSRHAPDHLGGDDPQP